MKINIVKCHGTGNDFILIDEYNNEYNFDDNSRKQLALKGCNREKSIGADGILFVQKSKISDAKMRIFNSDGSEAEMCGNGLRCVGRYVMEMLNKDKVEIETMKARYSVEREEDLYTGVKTVKIYIDSISLNPKSLPMKTKSDKVICESVIELSETLKFTAVSITNPHLVAITNKIEEKELTEVGIRGNNTKSILPNGVNISFLKVFDESNVYVKTYERGVGLTKSCGTAMTASSVVAALNKSVKFESPINVFNDGGAIKTIVHKYDGDKYMVEFIGNATYVFEGSLEFDEKGISNVSTNDLPYKDETEKYNNFFDFTREKLE